jgi:hypothetical protein
MPSRTRILKKWTSLLLLLVAAIPLWACGETFEVSITVQGTVATGKVEIEGKVRTFEGTVGEGGCVEWNIDGCQGRVCGLQSGSQCKVTCKDPLLAEWPDAWTLTGATWSAPDLGLNGDILVTPASSWVLPPEYGTIVTDPSHSAWVLKLDTPGDLGPTLFVLELVFDIGDPPVAGCIKGIDIATVESIGGLWPPVIVPTDPAMGVDFTVFHEGDPNVFCVGVPSPAENSTWGRLKSNFK